MGRIQSYKTYSVISYDQLTVSSSVVSLLTDVGIPAGNTNAATLVCVGNASDTDPVPLMYYTLDGTTPSASNGLVLYNGGTIEIFESELKLAKFLRATANDQTLKIEFATVE